MIEWKTYKLGELYNVFSGLSKSRDQFGYGHPFVTFKDVFDNYFLPESLSSLVNTSAKEIKSCSVLKGDIFLTRTSETQEELGMSSVALKDYPDATFNGFTKRLRLKADVQIEIDPLYIGYYLRSPRVRNQIGQHSSLTTRASLNSTAINSIEIALPEITLQFKIGRILKSLDDKIDLNRQTNATLEAIAQALFKEWFVDFNFPGATGGMVESELGMIPAGWTVEPLGNVVEIKGGTTPSTRKSEYWNGEFHWATPRDLSNLSSPILLRTERKITREGVDQIGSGIFPVGTLLLSSRAPIGYLALSEIPVSINQGFIAINSSNLSNPFLLFWLKLNMDTVVSRANGSTFLEISKTNFKTIPFVVPSKDVLRAFDIQMGPIIRLVANNEKQNDTLAQLRDCLLPNLINNNLNIQ